MLCLKNIFLNFACFRMLLRVLHYMNFGAFSTRHYVNEIHLFAVNSYNSFICTCCKLLHCKNKHNVNMILLMDIKLCYANKGRWPTSTNRAPGNTQNKQEFRSPVVNVI